VRKVVLDASPSFFVSLLKISGEGICAKEEKTNKKNNAPVIRILFNIIIQLSNVVDVLFASSKKQKILFAGIRAAICFCF
jgi:hypothetical protein